MKQPKKRWAWTARQRGRDATYRSWNYNWHQPAKWFVTHRWHSHRTQTRAALHQILCGADEDTVIFLYHHKNRAHWDWT